VDKRAGPVDDFVLQRTIGERFDCWSQ
jgi:hypothetical protein